MAQFNIRTFLCFCIVATIGLMVDSVLLELLVSQHFYPTHARIVSMIGALQVTYVLHGRFTFPTPYTRKTWLRFMLANSTGAFLNYLVFVVLMVSITLTNPLLHRQLALMMGTGVGLVFNFWANRRFVFISRNL